jgi:hypothetical protein
MARRYCEHQRFPPRWMILRARVTPLLLTLDTCGLRDALTRRSCCATTTCCTSGRTCPPPTRSPCTTPQCSAAGESSQTVVSSFPPLLCFYSLPRTNCDIRLTGASSTSAAALRVRLFNLRFTAPPSPLWTSCVTTLKSFAEWPSRRAWKTGCVQLRLLSCNCTHTRLSLSRPAPAGQNHLHRVHRGHAARSRGQSV